MMGQLYDWGSAYQHCVHKVMSDLPRKPCAYIKLGTPAGAGTCGHI